MDRDEIRDEILEILQEMHEDIDFEAETRMADDKVFDSFDIASLATELGDVFNIEITSEELIPENFNSVDSLADLVISLVEK